jgi:hypothetical protein
MVCCVTTEPVRRAESPTNLPSRVNLARPQCRGKSRCAWHLWVSMAAASTGRAHSHSSPAARGVSCPGVFMLSFVTRTGVA